MRVRTEDSRKRATHRSLVAAYLVVALFVAGLVASRWGNSSVEAGGETPAVAETASKASVPMRQMQTRPLLSPPKIEPQADSAPSSSAGVPSSSLNPTTVVATSSTQVEVASSTRTDTEFVEAAQVAAGRVSTGPATIDPKPVTQEPEIVLSSMTEDELRANLAKVAVEVDLHSGSPGFAQAGAQIKKIAEEYAKYGARFDRRTQFQRQIRRDPSDVLPGEKELVEEDSVPRTSEHVIEEWVAARPDLQGLPLRLGDSCKLDSDEAGHLMRASRGASGIRNQLDNPAIPPSTRNRMLGMATGSLLQDTSALVQIMQCGSEESRIRMVKMLNMKDDPEAISALTDRALFDLSPEIRRLALHMLKLTPVESVQNQLLAGLDYVWEPVAVNAANALVELDEDGVTLDELRKKLDVPDPHAPYKDEDGKWRIRELVRVNHLRNCLLCHAPSVEKRASFQAAVPEPGKPIPRNFYYGPKSESPSVRPDITYIVQDFSVMHELQNQKPWPNRQRFDYFVRERTVDESEARRLSDEATRKEPIRHRAIRYAIQKLSAKLDNEAPAEMSLAVR